MRKVDSKPTSLANIKYWALAILAFTLYAFLPFTLPSMRCPQPPALQQLQCPIAPPHNVERLNAPAQIQNYVLVPGHSPKCPACNCSTIQQRQYTTEKVVYKEIQKDNRPRVGISVLLNEKSTLGSVETLLKSDIMKFAHVDIFAFGNAPSAPISTEFLTRRFPDSLGRFSRTLLTVHNVTFDHSKGWFDPRHFCQPLNNTDNLGIVLPRIRIMLEILKGDYQWAVEMHDDMLFPKKWFGALLRRDGPMVGILMPRLLEQNVNGDLDPTFDYEPIVEPLKKAEVSGSAAPVHPWLLKLDMIRDVGYYDPMVSPWATEDSDFFYAACDISDWHCYSVGDSIVHHRRSKSWKQEGKCDKPLISEELLSVRYFKEGWLTNMPAPYFLWMCGAETVNTQQQQWRSVLPKQACDAFIEWKIKNIIDVRGFVRSGKTVQDWRWNRTAHLVNFTYYGKNWI